MAQDADLTGKRWVKVDPSDFEAADTEEGGGTTYYGGKIRVSNDTNVDITIRCSGNDRSDDNCYWPTTEAVLGALFPDGVPGVLDVDGHEDWCTNWEEFHDNVSGYIIPNTDEFLVYLDGSTVVILLSDGTQFIHEVPA